MLFVEGFVDFFGHFDGASNQLSDFQKLVWEGHQTPWSYPGICAASSLEAGHSKESAGWTTVAYIVPQLKVTGGTSERIYLGFATSG